MYAIFAQLPRHRPPETPSGLAFHPEEVLVDLAVDGPPREQEEEQSVLGR